MLTTYSCGTWGAWCLLLCIVVDDTSREAGDSRHCLMLLLWGCTIPDAMYHMQGNHLHLLLIIRCVGARFSSMAMWTAPNALFNTAAFASHNHPASILVYDYLPWWQNSRHCLCSNSCRRLTAKTTCSLWCSQRCVLQLRTGHETGRQLRSGSLHVTGFKTG